jgi:4-amino-4-deoxy-L-arabinose transferase-like glycosyltransferase
MSEGKNQEGSQDDKSNQEKEGLSLDLGAIFVFCKKHYIIILLLLFMAFGFYLRSYHMDFPVIGYHNMKENQYIPYTEFMYNADEIWDYFRTETYWLGIYERGYFTQYEFPLIPWIILLLWKIFGIHIWIARLVIILFSIGSIPLLYLVGRKLTENRFIILSACLFFTIMPISVFFGRNVQPESVGLFFILLASYWFFCWREKFLRDDFNRKEVWKYFIFFTVSLLLAVLLKVPNGIGFIPLLFFVPYKKLLEKKHRFLAFQYVVIFVCFMAIFPFWVKFSQWVMPGAATVGTSGFTESFRVVWHNTIRVFTSEYWGGAYPAIRAFFLDNFTIWFFWPVLVGIFFGLLKWKTKLGMFLIGSTVSILIYVMAFADKIRGHAYYQIVFLPLVCFAVAYMLYITSDLIYGAVKSLDFVPQKLQKYFHLALPWVLLVIFVTLAYPALLHATGKPFDVIYYGEDVAGDFINENSEPDERVFIDGVLSQSVGILWHAHRYGTDEITNNLTYFIELEEELNFRWVVLYGPGMATVQTKEDVWDYIQNNYKIAQIGLIMNGDELTPYYFILEKGGTFNPDESFVADSVPTLAQTYQKTTGEEFDFYVLDNLG